MIFSRLKNISFSTWVILVVIVIEIGVITGASRLLVEKEHNTWPLQTDAQGYYGYLPAYFFHGGEWDWIREPDLKPKLKALNRIIFLSERTGLETNKYSIGLSILTSPFFLVGHLIAQSSGYETHGYSLPYRAMIAFSVIFYTLLGMFFLRKTLLRFYSDYVAALTLIAIYLGTQLFYYTSIEFGMTHAYTFAFFSAFLFFMFRWQEKKMLRDMILLAVIAGIIFLIRPTNILVGLIPVLFLYKEITASWKQVLIAMVVGLIVISPQLLYWDFYRGSIFISGYQGEGFLFSDPAIWDVIFSYRKGWLIYTPMMVFSLLGLWRIGKYIPRFGIPLTLYVVVNIYVVSCWWAWWYGGSFGMRALIEMQAPLALSMGGFFTWLLEKKVPAKIFLYGSLILLVTVNLFQTHQYNKGIIHADFMSQKSYWYIFGKKKLNKKQRKINRNLLEDYDMDRHERSAGRQ